MERCLRPRTGSRRAAVLRGFHGLRRHRGRRVRFIGRGTTGARSGQAWPTGFRSPAVHSALCLLSGSLFSLLSGCLLDEVDLAGKRCRADAAVACAEGFDCDPSTGRCVRPSETRLSGGADAALDGGLDAGSEPDADAPSDGGPVDGGTSAGCEADRDCLDPVRRICLSGVCSRACNDPNGAACPSPASCDDATGHCLVSGACQSDQDCASPISVCVDGACQPGCTVSSAPPCRLDRVCSGSTGMCVGTSTCTADAGCPRGYWCDGRGCRQRCTEPGAPPCRGDSTCNSMTGRCDGALDIGAECTVDRRCASGVCLGLIIGGTEQARVCSRSCGATADCPLGTTCVPVSGAGQCIPERLLTGMNELSLRSGAMCEVDANRCQSLFCEGAVCVERCSRDRECAPFSGSCVSVPQDIAGGRTYLPRCVDPFVGGAVGESCQSNLDCEKGICDPDSATCATLCCADADCGSSESCLPLAVDEGVVRICRPQSGAGQREQGAPCTADADCATQVCAPIDAVNPGGARICSTYCCTDVDCEALPTPGRCIARPSPITNILAGRCVQR